MQIKIFHSTSSYSLEYVVNYFLDIHEKDEIHKIENSEYIQKVVSTDNSTYSYTIIHKTVIQYTEKYGNK